MRHILILGTALMLAGCGGGGTAPAPRYAPPSVAMPFALGPLNSACLGSERKARSRALCGCIQAVANQTLSGSQQRRAVAFYGDPHQAQVIRQSDRSGDERFWQAYRAYGERAERVCR